MDIAAVFLKILNMSFAGACAVVIVLLLRLLLKKLPKKYICILWTVILIRLLCPFTIPTLVIGQPDIPEPIPSNIMEVQNPTIYSEIEVVDNAVNRVLQENFTPNEDTFKTSANPLQIAMTIGAYIWCAGMTIMLGFTAWKLIRFHQWVKESVPDKTLGEHIYRYAIESPVVTGVLRPRIYLPFDLEEPQLLHVLAHERMHVQRKDHLLKLFFYIAVMVHWFNPFVWLAYRLLERDMEMACDEAVLLKFGAEEKTSYCESLLELATSKNHFMGNPVAFGESDVKVRIKNVLNYKKPYFWVSAIAVVIIIVVAVTCLSSPKGDKIWEASTRAELEEVKYPLTKEMVDEAFAQVDLPGVVSEEEYDSEIRTSLDIRDEENRLIAGIASNGDGDKRFLGINLIGYLQVGEATVFLPEEKWEDLIGFATLLYGFKDQSIIYNDFIEKYEEEAILTEYQREDELYYEKRYEWLKSYGEITCQIKVDVATDGTKDISSIAFFNTAEYSTRNSEMAAKNFLYTVFTSIAERYETYEEATGGKYDPVNRDEAFLESDYSFPYLNRYTGRVTENCLQNMEDMGYFTLVDYHAVKADAQVSFINAVLTESEETKGDKNRYQYLYTASLTCEKNEKTEDFTVQGQICVENQLNGWMIYDFLLSDTEALSMHITGENVYRFGDELPTDNEPQQLTMDILLEAVEDDAIEKVSWDRFSNGVEDISNGAALNYYISFDLEHAGKGLQLDCSFDKRDNTLGWIFLTIKEDESCIRIYDAEEGGLRISKDEMIDFVETDHNIMNEISFELPEGVTLDAYNANTGYEGGCLLLPMVYKGDEEATPTSWMSAGMVSRYTQSYTLEWKNEKIENVAAFFNHSYWEVVEQVEGLCAPALLMHFNHDLYTAAGLGELESAGIDSDSIEIQSAYWYLFIAEPGEEYGYVITLNQKNFTKEDILELGKTIQLIK